LFALKCRFPSLSRHSLDFSHPTAGLQNSADQRASPTREFGRFSGSQPRIHMCSASLYGALMNKKGGGPASSFVLLAGAT